VTPPTYFQESRTNPLIYVSVDDLVIRTLIIGEYRLKVGGRNCYVAPALTMVSGCIGVPTSVGMSSSVTSSSGGVGGSGGGWGLGFYDCVINNDLERLESLVERHKIDLDAKFTEVRKKNHLDLSPIHLVAYKVRVLVACSVPCVLHTLLSL